MEGQQQLPQPRVVILPSLGIGHIIPLVEFAKLLVSHFSFSVTLLLPPTEAKLSFLDSLPKLISYSFLPPLNPTHIPQDATQDYTISLTHFHSLSSIRSVLSSLVQQAQVVALVTDLFGTDLFDVARELNIPPYLFFTSSAMTLLFAFHLPKLDTMIECEYRDMPEPLILPGCVPLHGKDFAESTQNRKDDSYRVVLHHMKQYMRAEGIFVNSFLDLEPGAIHAFQTEDPDWPPVYPIGPIIQSSSGLVEDGAECLMWLDQQPPRSVVFV
ncbi:hydroquinone glucosyltransferase-like [Chenopodium quinoa]|uniref:hydroquinone glucosyltransferase-like n=1 Tax=Chenopodium quinoa TaxID=63459 RepID=UPI000B77495A|nr:hydroquinone glucosyltransferase-like [Chenopodium quinoa]